MRLRKGDHVKEHAWCGAASVNPAHPRMCCLSQIPGAVFNLESTDSSFIFLFPNASKNVMKTRVPATLMDSQPAFYIQLPAAYSELIVDLLVNLLRLK